MFPMKKVSKCTEKDKILLNVLQYIKHGWPNKISAEIKPYYERRQNLTTLNGVVVLQTDFNRVVIPQFLRRYVMKLIHEGHWGIVRTKQIARRYCWWPKIDKNIELIASCEECAMENSMPKKEKQF